MRLGRLACQNLLVDRRERGSETSCAQQRGRLAVEQFHQHTALFDGSVFECGARQQGLLRRHLHAAVPTRLGVHHTHPRSCRTAVGVMPKPGTMPSDQQKYADMATLGAERNMAAYAATSWSGLFHSVIHTGRPCLV